MENVSYTLNYDANGGESAPSVAQKNGNENYAIFRADDMTPIRDGFVFLGWSFSPDGEAMIHAGDLFTVTQQNVTLYAIWGEENVASVPGAEDENVEPLGVVASTRGEGGHSVINYTGVFILGGVIVLGLISLLVIRARSPRIVSKEYDS